MKVHVTKREVLALTTFLVPKPTPNLEQAHVRMSVWDALGAKELAYDISETASVNVSFDARAWLDKTPLVVDLPAAALDYVLKHLEGEVPGVFSEVLRPLQDRLISLRDKTYKLPQELRTPAAEAPAAAVDA